ncbi:hypothetical protein NLU13_4939 [Sarocladium strictum]|uniref:LysM domain-containing protein n=1 Tax=Sarocladium strictum TaxID=5046 RepID=A0AA39L8P0_SARSR|nr:hypothetical protein NLU13_4939 [Sarocladium strictum]
MTDSHFTSTLRDSSSVRSRNTRLLDEETSKKQGSGLLSAFSPVTSRAGSPSSSSRANRSLNQDDGGNGNIGQFLNESLYSSWSSVSGFATSLLGSGELPGKSGARSSSHARAGARGRQNLPKPGSLRTARSWGPAPPTEQPGLGVISGGTLADREAALKAAKTASVLESHDGVNGGLDVTGRHKRRNSDDVKPPASEGEEVLVYIHWVQSSDTYQGLILRYKCREDAFRRANGLWSRDTIQTRKWLTIPVDACELRGRPCEPPTWHNERRVDLLAPTPKAEDQGSGKQPAHDDFFSRPLNGGSEDTNKPEDEYPWTHVRWVKVDSMQQPVEIARVSRQAIGYFPPRRRKSIRTYSTLSTPRQSLDLSSNPPGSVEGPSSRRESSLGSRPQLSTTPVSTRSRMNSVGADTRPMWMRRPGGVGSLGKTVRAPGPEKDYFNTFTKKHIPGLNIDGPSMSIMGSETAHFGFGHDSATLVESPFEEGRDAASSSRQGTGLDKAAAAVEMWLRGALSKRPSTPMMAGLARYGGRNAGTEDSDLIELTDTASDDGRLLGDSAMGLLDQPIGTTGRSGGEGSVIRGRGPTSGNIKGSKDD